MNLLASLPIARYRFTAKMRDTVRLPDYAGSLLRGQFGAALRGVACMTRQPVCTGCPLLATCPYTRVFEALPPQSHGLQKFSAIPNAYVIEPPAIGVMDLAVGETLVFHMVLAGDAIEQLALIVFAWQRALTQGLTRSRSAADLLSVEWVDGDGAGHSVWHRDDPVLATHPATLAEGELPAPALQAVTLHIHTPMRLQQQGQPLRVDQLTPRALIAAVARRVALVMEFHARQVEWGHEVPRIVQLAENVSDQRDLHWHDWTRYSSRQQQEMTLGGALGRWTLKGRADTLAALWPWLWLGQWLHVGKNATMGMGGYTLERGFL